MAMFIHEMTSPWPELQFSWTYQLNEVIKELKPIYEQHPNSKYPGMNAAYNFGMKDGLGMRRAFPSTPATQD